HRMREQIETEARAAAGATGALTDEAVSVALATAGGLVAERADEIADANAADMAAARDLDEGARDRLLLDEERITALGEELRSLARMEPLDRVEAAWLLANGLQVEVRRIPIGAVGAN